MDQVNCKRVADQDLVAAYNRTKNIWKAAEEVGLCGQSVWERLKRLKVRLSHPQWTDEEAQLLKAEYVIYKDAGKLRELATKMGRTVPFICRQARELGLTNPNHPRQYIGKWKYMTEGAARVLMDKFKRSRFGLNQYCARYGYDSLGFSTTLRRFFPDEWDAVIESKQPHQTLYRLGRSFEYRVRDALRAKGFIVLRSPRSGSPIDLIAVRKAGVLFIQCKRGDSLCVDEWNELYKLALSVNATPVMASSPQGRGMILWKMTGLKDGSKRKQPRIELLLEEDKNGSNI